MNFSFSQSFEQINFEGNENLQLSCIYLTTFVDLFIRLFNNVYICLQARYKKKIQFLVIFQIDHLKNTQETSLFYSNHIHSLLSSVLVVGHSSSELALPKN
jgi:hypothetical protein